MSRMIEPLLSPTTGRESILWAIPEPEPELQLGLEKGP
jgi:hypothetical protein